MINVFLSNQFNQITGQIKTNKMDPGDYKDLREQGMKKTKTITLILRACKARKRVQVVYTIVHRNQFRTRVPQTHKVKTEKMMMTFQLKINIFTNMDLESRKSSFKQKYYSPINNLTYPTYMGDPLLLRTSFKTPMKNIKEET